MKKLQMFDMPTIGIVGLGFVGSAIRDCYEDHGFNIVCVDVDPAKATGTYDDLKLCEAVFVCVPSPSKENGECDTSILNMVLYFLQDYKNVIISKTTAPPAFYEKIQKAYPNLVYVPEFLTANNAVKDFNNTDFAIVGGSVQAYQRETIRLLSAVQPIKNHVFVSIGEAALIKYIVNSFLATKVVFMNEMAELSTAHGYDWNNIIRSLSMEKRMGTSHFHVPGPDNHHGFGGHCFPKDTNAFVKYASKLSVQLSVLKSAIKKNTLLRLTKPK